MSTFVDTSAFYAVLDAGDDMHPKARSEWLRLLREDVGLCTTNYVLVETLALLQSRIGLEAVRLFSEDIAPVLNLIWVDSTAHELAIQLILTAGRRDLSFVDYVSFQTMRKHGVRAAFCFDPHFTEQGFKVFPS